MPKIQIICTNPGMRRLGAVHPASATYEDGEWTPDELEVFRADPAFHVSEVSDNAVTRGPEFDDAVRQEVEKRVGAMAEAMKADFARAVSEAAAENVKEAESNKAYLTSANETLTAQLLKAATENAELKAAAAKAKPAKTT